LILLFYEAPILLGGVYHLIERAPVLLTWPSTIIVRGVPFSELSALRS
jgi:hypothetical protein